MVKISLGIMDKVLTGENITIQVTDIQVRIMSVH